MLHHRYKARYLLLIPLIWVVFLGSTHPTSAQTGQGTTDLDIILVIDESGSMWLTNDPPILKTDANGKTTEENPGWRIVMADMFADLLGVEASGDHRLGVVMFGTDAKLVQPLTSLKNEATRDSLKTAIDDAHENLKWTDILEALVTAEHELDSHGRSGANVKRAVIFLSDGVYETHANMTQEERDDAYKQIRQLVQSSFVGKYPVYTVALTSDAFKKDPGNLYYKNIWDEIASNTGAQYFEPEVSAPENRKSLLDAYHAIICRLLETSCDPLPSPVTAPTETTFPIEDGLQQVIFTIVKYEPGIKITIIRPNGIAARPTDPDVAVSQSNLTESWSFERPQRGIWTVRLEGNGKVTVFNIPFPRTSFKIERSLPGNTHPQGKPMGIAVRVVDSDHRIQSPQELNLSIQKPDGTTESVPLVSKAGTYTARFDDTSALGSYILQFKGKNNNIAFHDEQSVNVLPAPWLNLIEPVSDRVYPINQPVPIRAQLMLGTEAITSPDPSGELKVVTELADGSGSILDTRQLRLSTGGNFEGQVDVNAQGDYLVRAIMTFSRPSGEKFTDISEVSIHAEGTVVTPTNQPTLTPAPTFTALPPATALPTVLPTATLVPQTSIDFRADRTSILEGECATLIWQVQNAQSADLDGEAVNLQETRQVCPKQTTSYQLVVLDNKDERQVRNAKIQVNPPPPWGLIVIGLILLGILAGVGFWYYNLPALAGTLYIDDIPKRLGGKFPVKIGSNPKLRFNVQGEAIQPEHIALKPYGSRKNPLIEAIGIGGATFKLNDMSDETRAQLHDGDEIGIGDQTIKYENPLAMHEEPPPDDFTGGSDTEFDYNS